MPVQGCTLPLPFLLVRFVDVLLPTPIGITNRFLNFIIWTRWPLFYSFVDRFLKYLPTLFNHRRYIGLVLNEIDKDNYRTIINDKHVNI